MKLIIILKIIFVVLLRTTASINFKNNACKNFINYRWKSISRNCYENPNFGAPTPEIIQKHGLNAESHFVTTKDGQILQLFRIVPKDDDNRKKKQPIFFETGILSDSSAFVFAGERSLALTLAKEGYDVWIRNYRGSIYSRNHTKFSPSEEAYWNFTLDFVAEYDIPPSLEKVADVTGQAGNIIYIAHSRGTILGFMYFLNNPNLKMLRGMVTLAPVAYQDPHFYIRLIYGLAPIVERLLPLFRMWAFFQYPTALTPLVQFICPFFPYICLFIAKLPSGQSEQFLPDDLLNFFNYFPAPYSIREYTHEGQLIQTGRLQKYDYGRKKNLQVYGQKKPPVYDLGKITIPVFLFYDKNDVWISENSVKRQYDDLGSSEKGIFRIPVGVDDEREQWAHNDFLYAKDLKEDLSGPMKTVLDKLAPT